MFNLPNYNLAHSIVSLVCFKVKRNYGGNNSRRSPFVSGGNWTDLYTRIGVEFMVMNYREG